MKKVHLLTLAGFAAACAAGAASADIYVCGNATTNLITALNNLGETYSILSTTIPTQAQIDSLAPDDFLLWGQDGGTTQPPNLNAWLDSGGHVALTGGSNWDLWRAWALNYFDTTDTGSGWHTDGAWHKTSNHPANDFLPDDYSFSEVGHTYHMLAFLPSTPNSTILGENDEPNNIACVRDYNNGGSFNYMALDLGIRPQDQDFIDSWVKGALQTGPARFSMGYSGGCPGQGTVSWRNAAPNRTLGLVFGNNLGNTNIPNNYPCAGTPLGIQGQVRLIRNINSGNGNGSVSGPVGTSACNHYLQMVQGGTCETTNPVQIR